MLSDYVFHVCYTCYFLCCCFSVAKSCFTLCKPLGCIMTGSSVLHYLLGFAQIRVESVMLCNHLTFCCPLLLLPSVFAIRVFSSESALRIRWPKYWSLSFGMSPFNEYSGFISLRIDWFDLLATQGTLKSSPAPQFESISSSALSLLYAYMTTGKTVRLTVWTFAGKVVSLLFNTLPRFVIAFLPRS